MFESLNDPVDVLTAYVEGGMQPLRFRWRGSKWILSRAWIGGEA